MNKKVRLMVTVITLMVILLGFSGQAWASGSSLRLYQGGNDPDGVPVGQETNNIFYDQSFNYPYSGGPVCLSSQDGQCTAPAIDDEAIITVNGVVLDYPSFTHEFGPIDFTPYLHNGDNQIRVQLVDRMGPSRGGSQLWLVAASGGGGSLPSLRLIGIRIEPEQIEFSTNQVVKVMVNNPADVSQSENFTLSGTNITDQVKNETISGQTSQEVVFDGIKQRFDFIDPSVAADCYSMYGFLFPVAQDLIPIGGDIWSIYENVKTLREAHFDNEYVYSVSMKDQKLTIPVIVVVPKHKPIQLVSSMALDLLWPKLTLLGIRAGVVTPPALALEAISALGWQMSCDLKQNASDPDMNFTEIAVPIHLTITGLTDLPDGPEKQAVIDMLKWMSDLRALNTSLARYEGAKEAGANDWAEIQLRAARKYAVDVIYDIQIFSDSYQSAFGNLTTSNQDVENAKQFVLANGLPSEMKSIIGQLGSSYSDANDAERAFLNVVDQSNAIWPDGTDLAEIVIPAYLGMVDYQSSQIKTFSGDANLDIVPPNSSIQLDGTFGLNNWHISDVTITLTATDNPGGSGIQKIEWSLDDGRSWYTYSAPFVFTQEGNFHLIVRATDNEGNIEYPPATADFKVDKTPPVVTVATDQTEYTRIQLFLVHFSGYDPMPGSGLASLTAIFNEQNVIDGQSIDMFWWNLGQYTLTVTGQDYAGWTTTNSKSIKLIATIESLQGTVSRLCVENYITKHGVCNSLLQKLDAALAAQNRGQPATAVNILYAFQNDIKAQSGKAIKSQAVQLLLADTDFVISALGRKK